MDERTFFIYILSNPGRTTLYIGITNNLSRRVEDHRIGTVVGFAKRYRCTELIYYELFTTAYDAITREKQLKRWSRVKKLDLIRRMNPTVRDLTNDLA